MFKFAVVYPGSILSLYIKPTAMDLHVTSNCPTPHCSSAYRNQCAITMDPHLSADINHACAMVITRLWLSIAIIVVSSSSII